MFSWKECAVGAYYLSTLPCAAAGGDRPRGATVASRCGYCFITAWPTTSQRLDDVDARRSPRRFTGCASASTGEAGRGTGADRIGPQSLADGVHHVRRRLRRQHRFAVPLLLKHQIPFTYFVSTDHVLGGEPFPHDVQAGRPLASNTLAQLRELAAAGVEIGAHTRSHADFGANLSTDATD